MCFFFSKQKTAYDLRISDCSSDVCSSDLKYLDGARPQGSRMVRFTRFTRYDTPTADAATRAYFALAREHGFDPAQMALAFVSSRSLTTSNIIGDRKSTRLNSSH